MENCSFLLKKSLYNEHSAPFFVLKLCLIQPENVTLSEILTRSPF